MTRLLAPMTLVTLALLFIAGAFAAADAPPSADANTPTPTSYARVTIIDTPDPVAAGGTLRYLITVRNVSTYTLQSVWLEDKIAAGLLFQSASNGGVRDGTSVAWSIGSLAGNASFSADVVVSLLATARPGDTIGNEAEASFRQPGN